MTGTCPASPARQGGVEGLKPNRMNPPFREAPPVRAGSFTWMRNRMCLSPLPMPFILSAMLFCLLLHPMPEVSASKESVERGRKFFNSQICRDCHRMQGRGGLAAPDLTGLWNKGKTRDYVIDHLRNPHKYDHFTIMPDFHFSPEEEEALADYLLSPK